jgi:hypothetical protein
MTNVWLLLYQIRQIAVQPAVVSQRSATCLVVGCTNTKGNWYYCVPDHRAVQRPGALSAVSLIGRTLQPLGRSLRRESPQVDGCCPSPAPETH